MAASLSEYRQFLHLQHRMHGATSRRNGDANSSSIPNPANIPITCSTNMHGVTNRNEIQNKASPNTHINTHTDTHNSIGHFPARPELASCPPPRFSFHLFLCCARHANTSKSFLTQPHPVFFGHPLHPVLSNGHHSMPQAGSCHPVALN